MWKGILQLIIRTCLFVWIVAKRIKMEIRQSWRRWWFGILKFEELCTKLSRCWWPDSSLLTKEENVGVEHCCEASKVMDCFDRLLFYYKGTLCIEVFNVLVPYIFLCVFKIPINMGRELEIDRNLSFCLKPFVCSESIIETNRFYLDLVFIILTLLRCRNSYLISLQLHLVSKQDS